MKWLLICVLIVVIMIIAKKLSEQYKDRYDFYYNLHNFLLQFKINVSFKQDKLNTFLKNIKPKKSFKLFIDAYLNYLSTNQLDLSTLNELDEEEKEQLKQIVFSLGKNDAKTELSQMENYIVEVSNKMQLALQTKDKLCPMILKLSLLFAIALAIILI